MAIENNNNEGPLLMTKEGVAELLGIKIRTVNKYIAEGRIPFIRISNKVIRFHRLDLMESLRNRAA